MSPTSTDRFTWLLAAALASFALPGCTGAPPPPQPPSCDAEHRLSVGSGQTCIGAPQEAECPLDVCAQGVSCLSFREAHDDAELAAALAAASVGDCVLLHPHHYLQKVTLDKAWVSLLGRFHEDVLVDSVEIDSDDVSVRGIAVGSGGLVINGAKNAQVTDVRVTGSLDDGVRLTGGATAWLRRVDVVGSAKDGILALDASALVVESTLVTGVPHGPPGAGIWAECAGGCSCASAPQITIESSAIRRNTLVGVGLVGVSATLASVEISGQSVALDGTPAGGLFGGGCASVMGSALAIDDNDSFGVLMDDASGTLGADGEGNGVAIRRNHIGFWAQRIAGTRPDELRLQYATLDGNHGVGFGVAQQSEKTIVYCTDIENTEDEDVPVRVNGMVGGNQTVGDGVSWLGNSALSLELVSVSGSGRASILIDGPVGPASSLKNIALAGGDDGKGIQQQNYPAGGAQPAMSGSVPPIATSPIELYAVPLEPPAP